MGYYTRVDGHVTFSPELSGSELLELQEWVKNSSYLDYGGQLGVTSFTYESEGKMYGFEDELKQLVERLSSKVAREVHGEFTGVGEEQPDIWRLKVSGTTLTREEAKMVWPDGTEFRG